MRIGIDMQGAQAGQRFDASGRCALSLVRALVRQRGQHEVVLALNGRFPHTIDPLRAAFDRLLSQDQIRVWHTPDLPMGADSGPRRALAESVREAFLASLGDVVLVTSAFDGTVGDAVFSVGVLTEHPPVAVLVHDLRCLESSSSAAHLSRAAQLLAIAPDVAGEAIRLSGPEVIDLSTELPVQPAKAAWDHMARRTLAALETLHASAASSAEAGRPDALLGQLIARVPQALDPVGNDTQLRMWAHVLSRFPQSGNTRQLLVDVSELVQRDARTGVQRVTRSIVRELLDHPPPGHEVALVYVSGDGSGYRYAHAFTAQFLGKAAAGADAPIDFQAGDIFLGLDLLPHMVPQQRPYLHDLHRDGVRICFVVYDLLPVLMPEYFPPGTAERHRSWLETICAFDGVICISRAVAQDLASWQHAHAAPRLRPLDIGWFHLGADVGRSAPSRGMPDNAAEVLARLGRCPTLLAVGTIEPRKQYGQLLAAAELLWARGTEINVVMVGKEGWMVDELVARLREHPEAGKRLFWLEGISDEYLEQVYAASTCLVAPSMGEGFGLPLIEAAQHGLPIIARDLTVFREVGGENAYYFSGTQGQDLAQAIADWLALHAAGSAPSPAGLPWLTWADSARQLLQVALGQERTSAQLLTPAAPSARRPRVLTLAPYPVRRPRHGGQLRAAAMLRVYEAAGFDVHPVGFYQAEAYEAADIGLYDIAFPGDSPFRNYHGVPMPALSDFLMGPFALASDAVFRTISDALPGPVDVIQVEQPWLYALARRLQLDSPLCRGALLVNSSHNIEAPMKRAILGESTNPVLIEQAVADMAAIERELAREAELSLAVTREDAEALRGYGAPRVLHAANGISPWHADAARCAQWRTRLPEQPWPIFIASAHPPNYTGFIEAIGDSLACIPEGSKLVVAGGVGPHLERELAKSRWGALNQSRLQVLGVLDDADLAAVKSLAHAFLLPIGGGGGSNIKTAEALYSGRPVVCTRTALRGFEHFAGLPGVTVAATPEQFQAGIRKVLEQATAPAPAVDDLRASLTWDACLGGVPPAVAALLAQREEKA